MSQRLERFHRRPATNPLTLVFERLPVAALLIGPDSRILKSNAAAQELLRCDETLLQGTPTFWDVFAPESLPEPLPDITTIDSAVQLRCFVKGDAPFPAEVHAIPLTEACWLVCINDVTHSLEQEERLAQVNQYLDQSPSSVFIVNRKGNIEYTNSSLTQMSGFSQSDLIGRRATILHSDELRVEDCEVLIAELRKGAQWSGVSKNRRKDGTHYIAMTTLKPIHTGGVINGYLGVVEDITEKQRDRSRLEALVAERTEQLATAVKEAEAANLAKSAFLANTSHEIRTPMHGVIGLIEVLMKSRITPDQMDLAGTIRASAFALLRVIDDILDFSKIEAGRMVLDYEQVPLRPLIEGLCFSLQPYGLDHGVSLHVYVDPALPPAIDSDPMRLRQILNNLVGNAIKFSGKRPQRGEVSIRATSERGWLKVAIADNGVGIPQSDQERIFNAFEQGSRRRSGGTGLGLSICHRLVDLLGGQISLESQPGAGSTFTVLLPLNAGLEASLPTDELKGLRCCLWMPPGEQAADWQRYLEFAGAEVIREPFETPQALLSARGPLVILAPIDSRMNHDVSNDLPVRFVCLHHGEVENESAAGSVLLRYDSVHRETLLNAVRQAAGIVSEPSVTTPPSDAVPELRESLGSDSRPILVVEDDPIGQTVIKRQLELLGLSADLSHDGADALKKWESSRRYALILTDLSMPELDGYELARQIRMREAATEHVPIVALTANALRREARRCAAAGMDDYLSKPVLLEQLRAVLGRWLGKIDLPRTTKESAAQATTLKNAIIDRSALPKLLGGSLDRIAALRMKFISAAEAAAQEIYAAVQEGDLRKAGSLAHRLKSSARVIGAFPLGDITARLEELCVRQDAASAYGLLPEWNDSLQAAIAASSELIEADGQAQPPGGFEIVLVDDDPLLVEVMTRQLTACGQVVCQAFCSPRRALRWLEAHNTPNVFLLLDLDMPDMDGIEFIRRLADVAFAGVLSILSAADKRLLESSAKVATAYKIRLLGHVQKPASLEALQRLLADARKLTQLQMPIAVTEHSPEEVRHAMREGQILLHYQPKVSISDGALIGAEALVRWQHPRDGLLVPSSFMSAAETPEVIEELTRTVLTQALDQAQRWALDGLPIGVAVNISRDNLVQLDFPELIVSELDRRGLPPESLVLEITETRLMRNVCSALDILSRLSLKNIRLSIDDFGTGHSSLSQLRDIPFDELKIDRGFVSGARANSSQRAICTASIEMAHSLGMKVIAEGVENESDWDFVRDTGCDAAQGYFVARPMPGAYLPEWQEQWRHRYTRLQEVSSSAE